MSALFEVLKRLELEDRKQREAGLPPEQRHRSITQTTGQVLSMLVRLSKAIHVVEIGTSIGYSTLWLALGAKTTCGKVISYEIDTARVAKARINIEQAGLSEVVEVRNEDPMKAELPETDFVFLDAEKRDYIEHFKAVFPKLLPRGIVVADNVLSHQEELKNYLEYVHKLPSCNSLLLPIDRGLELTYKFAEKEFVAFRSLFSSQY